MQLNWFFSVVFSVTFAKIDLGVAYSKLFQYTHERAKVSTINNGPGWPSKHNDGSDSGYSEIQL